jgi:hypothetical protein
MSLYPSDGGNGGGSDSIYPDTTPGVNAWSQFQATSDVSIVSYNIGGVNNISASSVTVGTDISGGGNVYIGGYIQAEGKLQTPQIQIPNDVTPATITTVETNGSGEIIITTDGGGLTVLNGSAPATINAGELALTGNGTITGVDSLTLTGAGSISGVESINGQAFSGLVTNPLQGNLDAGTHDITNVGELDPSVVIMPTNSTFTPTYNRGQIYFDGSLFQFSAPISVPLPGAGFGPINIVQNKAQNGSGGDLAPYYRYNQGVIQWAGRLSQPNPFGYYNQSGINTYWLVSFGSPASPTQYMAINPGIGYIQSMIFNWSIIQVNIRCSNMIVGSFPSTADYIMCGNGSATTPGNEGVAGNITTPNQLNLIRYTVPVGDSATRNQGQLPLTFNLIKGVHYTNNDTTLDFFMCPSGTQQFGNIYGSSPPGSWLNWEIIGIM